MRADPSPLPDYDALLAGGADVLWCAAHPDDEFLFGSLLCRATLHHGRSVRAVILTHGDGGESAIDLAGEPLGDVRAREMAAVAEALHLDLELHDLWNAPLPSSTFPTLEQLWARWSEDADPVELVTRAILDARPQVVLTFGPEHGATGHPEHRLAARITTAAVRAAAERGHEVPRLYYVLKHHWLWRIVRDADPGPYDEVFDGSLPCADGRRCIDVLCDATTLHRTQRRDMAAFRRARRLFTRVALRRVDARAPDAALPPGLS
ncbi:MAG: PIG-L family deacetylase [Deltaproteobacteria bacterium]|nr:PIG-L family deacetylase [Deltaproteobacteria bacterium]